MFSSDENEDPGVTTTAVVYASADGPGSFAEQDSNITITTQASSDVTYLSTPKSGSTPSSGATGSNTCSVCNKTFKSRHHLDSHMLSHSEDCRVFACELCPKTFKTKSNLNRHVEGHSDIPKYSCEVCGRKFVVQGNLKKHMRIHDDNFFYSCPTCDRKFKHRSGLNTHILSHEVDKVRYNCVVMLSRK